MGGYEATITLVGFSSSDVAAAIEAFEELKPNGEFGTTAIYKTRHAD
ncbi:hypothetical protein [Rhodanobacter terrae]|uniref:YCII-related domain-containing protein n=1 Tax=Rhodanobacter terrae TaxID=418647 RepID=A0ABW0T1E0_9GAMM